MATVLLTSCRAGPPLSRESEFGLVRAHTERELSWIAPALEIVPEVEELFGTRVDRPREWWVWDTPFAEDSDRNVDRAAVARTLSDRIEFGELCIWNPRHFVAHEYAHWVIHRVDPFHSVPYFVEEGLAEWVARELTGWNIDSSRGIQVGEDFSLRESGLSLDLLGWSELGPEEATAAKQLALGLVEAIGMEGVRELAAAGATRRDYLRAAAEASDEFTYTEPESEPHELATDEE